MTIIPPLDVARRSGLSLILPTALAAGLATGSGCSSGRTDTSAAAEKAYGAEMARKGFWHEALFRFEKAARERPNDAELQNDLAVALEAVGETARALAVYRRALELAPNETHIRRNYARFAEYYTATQRAGSGGGTFGVPSPPPAGTPAPAATPAPPPMPPESPTPAPAATPALPPMPPMPPEVPTPPAAPPSTPTPVPGP